MIAVAWLFMLIVSPLVAGGIPVFVAGKLGDKSASVYVCALVAAVVGFGLYVLTSVMFAAVGEMQAMIFGALLVAVVPGLFGGTLIWFRHRERENG